MRGDPWTSERIELLRKLWGEGDTAAAIAARLGGISRSAVMGKVFRLRLHAGQRPAESQPRENEQANDDQSYKATAPIRRRRSAVRKRPSQPAPTGGGQHKTLLELTNHTCRWPHGRPGTSRFFFCGAPEADLERGVPYCARHMRCAYSDSVSSAEGAAAVPRGAGTASVPVRFVQRPILTVASDRGRPRQF
jgi:GcrA cell cycle regulator